MMANPILLQKKYARIVMLLAEKENINVLDALKQFYHSQTYKLMREGIADIHCEGDLYLVDVIMDEKRDF